MPANGDPILNERRKGLAKLPLCFSCSIFLALIHLNPFGMDIRNNRQSICVEACRNFSCMSGGSEKQDCSRHDYQCWMKVRGSTGQGIVRFELGLGQSVFLEHLHILCRNYRRASRTPDQAGATVSVLTRTLLPSTSCTGGLRMTLSPCLRPSLTSMVVPRSLATDTFLM